MQTHFLTRTTVAAMMLVTAACSETAKTENKMTNDELERLVAAKINGEPRLTAYDIKVSGDTEKNQVTISGAVPTEGLRTLAVDLANTGRVGLTVTSKIDVKPGEVERKDFSEEMARETRDRAKETGESVGLNLEDAWIHTKIRSKLLREGEFPGGSINVDVTNNAVTLRGDVSSSEGKSKAAEIAQSIDGVKSVNNRLVIRSNR